MIRRASGAIERLEAGGLPLGILGDAKYESGQVALQPGDWLLIFTDGLVEAVNTRGEEFGEERVIPLLHAGAGASPAELLKQITTSLDAFVGNTPQHDDVTAMLLKFS
jgi:sigma-B regulation protein RsbU (phosphoserine phosphatase)